MRWISAHLSRLLILSATVSFASFASASVDSTLRYRFLFKFGEGRFAANLPGGIAIDDKLGRVYIACSDETISVFRASDGKFLRQFEAGETGDIIAMAVDPQHRIYALSDSLRKIIIYRKDGKAVKKFDVAELNSEAAPSDMKLGQDGTMYISYLKKNSIRVINRENGSLVRSIGLPAERTEVGALSLDSVRGIIYGLEWNRADPIVTIHLNSDPAPKIAAPTGVNANALYGLMTDSTGRIYIRDSFNGRILVLDQAGRVAGTITPPGDIFGGSAGDAGNLNGMVFSGHNLFVVDPAGVIWVFEVEQQNH